MRDLQGNVLAVYEHKHAEGESGTFTLAEQHLYGASRIGMTKPNLALNTTTPEAPVPTIHYELTNHLGNVMAVITDEPTDAETPAVESLTDYYPFGMTMPGRSYNAHTYRHGFTGHEKESDLSEGIYTTEYRLYDARVGRWLSVDPLFEKYVGMSPYNYCAGNPVKLVDPDGRVFTEETEAWAKRMEEYATARIAALDEKIAKKEQKGKDATNLHSQKNEYINAQKEIEELRGSDQVYHVDYYEQHSSSGEKDSRGFVSYNQGNGQFIINLNKVSYLDSGSDLGVFAHEFKHAYQFEKGRLSFLKDENSIVTKRSGYLYDLTDEYEAHQRGSLFDAVGLTPDAKVYPNIGKEERHIGDDNIMQYNHNKNFKRYDPLENDIYRIRK